MWFMDLLTSFSGRIPRSRFWLGILVLLAASMVAGLATTDFSAINWETGEVPPPTLANKILGLVLLVPIIAVIAKRLNDRDRPSWLIWLVVLVNLPFVIGPFLGYFTNPNAMSNGEMFAFVPYGLVFLWVLIDAGFLKGTEGPNQFGPDPLANMT